MKCENQRTKSIALCSGMLICELVHVPIALRLKTLTSCVHQRWPLPVGKCYRYHFA